MRRRLRSFIFTPAERPTGSSTQCSRGTGRRDWAECAWARQASRLRKKREGFSAGRQRNATCSPSRMIKNVTALSGKVENTCENKQQAMIKLIIRLILMFLFLFCHLRISKHVNSQSGQSLWSRYKPHHAANKCFNAVLLASPERIRGAGVVLVT